MIRVYETRILTGPDADEKRRKIRHDRVFPPPSERSDVSDLMGAIEKKGLPKTSPHFHTNALHSLTNGTSGEDRISLSQAEVIWDELKEERNALTAITLEKFWPGFVSIVSARLKHHIKQYKPSGTSSLIVPNTTVSFEHMLGHFIEVQKQKNIQGQKKSLKQFLNRLEAITDFGFEFKRWNGGPGNLQHFILRGFNTGKAMLNSLMMIGVTQLLARGIPCTKNKLKKFIRANMRHITMSASTNIEHGPLMANIFDDEATALMKSLGCDDFSKKVRRPSSALHNFSFNEKTFELVPKVALHEHVADDSYLGIPPAIGDILPRGKTTGCPARYVRFLFKQLGELYVDISAQLLAKKYESDQAKIIALRTMFESL